jgi:hypothetical protein
MGMGMTNGDGKSTGMENAKDGDGDVEKVTNWGTGIIFFKILF